MLLCHTAGMSLDEHIEKKHDIFVPPPGKDVNVPWLYRWAPINHYYGDTVRQLLLGAAAIMLVAAPFYTDNLTTEMPFIVLGALALVAVSALTNPWKSGVMSADAVASGVGLVIFELWAIGGYGDDQLHKFVLREALAIIFLFAFYYSTKTLRSMIMKEVGRRDPVTVKREDPTPSDLEAVVDTKKLSRQELSDLNDYEKMEYSD